MIAGLALLLLVHNYGVTLLPEHRQILSPALMQPEWAGEKIAFAYPFDEGVPDRQREMRSRLVLTEDGRPHEVRTVNLKEIREAGGDRFAHLPGRIVFATTDNSDPRTNGRVYAVAWPWLFSPGIGRASLLALGVALVGLAGLGRRSEPRGTPAAVGSGRAGWWLWGLALGVFLAGLLANTGTRAPYAITFAPMYTDPATGSVYNQDHPHFRVMFDFVDGQPRSVWDGALFLRRILYPVLTWPAMKLLGFETGGVAMNFLLNGAAFIGVSWWLRRRVGERAALMGAALLATYPGFAYWVGMPYQYALIAPGSLLLTIALRELVATPGAKSAAGWGLLMGVMYLAYDFGPVFLPASLGVLLWRRRWRDTLIVAATGVLPLTVWLLTLRFGLGQSLGNSNAGIYQTVATALLDPESRRLWLAGLPGLMDTLAAVLLGSNFIFLPAFFLAVVAINFATGRIRPAAADLAIVGVTGLLFLAINLVPMPEGQWNMSGSWVARLYQPVFPAMLFFVATWWQAWSPSRRRMPWLVGGLLGLAMGANLLVVFGPLAGDPWRVSGQVFYRFYTHADGLHLPVYENTLRRLPPRLYGGGQAEP